MMEVKHAAESSAERAASPSQLDPSGGLWGPLLPFLSGGWAMASGRSWFVVPSEAEEQLLKSGLSHGAAEGL